MYVKDFVYDDKLASDYGLAICHVNSENSMNISMGSNIEIETVKQNDTQQNLLIKSNYTEVLSVTFDVIKINCKNENDYELSANEIEFIMKWLNRKEMKIFQPIYENGDYSDIYYKGTFTNIQALSIQGKIIGMTLTFTSDSSYGYTDAFFDYELSTNDEIEIYVDSSENGYIYPHLDIDILESGTFSLQVKFEEKVLSNIEIKNCIANEHLTIDSKYKYITTDNQEHRSTLPNDFNYDWVSLESSISNSLNQISTNLPCIIKATYTLPRKVGILV